MKKILIRSASGAVYVALIVTALYIGRWTGVEIVGQLFRFVLFGFVAFVGLFEYYRCAEFAGQTHQAYQAPNSASGAKINKPLGYFISAVQFVALYVLIIMAMQWTAIVVSLIVALLAAPLSLMWQLWRHDERPMEVVANTLLGIVYVVEPIILLVCTAEFFPQEGCGLLMMVFILVWVNDTGAYLSGMALGRHKLWPRHSPGKTWEGLIGGALFCVAAAAMVGPMFIPQWSRVVWAAVAVMVTAAGTLGDLVESMLKRSAGVKDSGSIMPGHGGILDRFDSMLMIAPFLFVFVLFMF